MHNPTLTPVLGRHDCRPCPKVCHALDHKQPVSQRKGELLRRVERSSTPPHAAPHGARPGENLKDQTIGRRIQLQGRANSKPTLEPLRRFGCMGRAHDHPTPTARPAGHIGCREPGTLLQASLHPRLKGGSLGLALLGFPTLALDPPRVHRPLPGKVEDPRRLRQFGLT